MPTVVVTGATGIVGSRVVQQLAQQGYHVHAMVHTPLATGHPLYQSQVSVTVVDYTMLVEEELMAWLGTVRPLALIHCMALTDLTTCEYQPERTYQLNTHVTRLLARACARYRTHFLMLSTEYVFDGTRPPGQVYPEYDPVHPLNHYAKSKLQAELAVQEECSDTTSWTICRSAVVYGAAPWSRTDFTQWLRKQIRQQKPLRIADDQISSPTYAIDLANMLIVLTVQRVQGIFHTAGNTPINRYQFALKIAALYDLNTDLLQPATTSELGLALPRPLNTGLSVDKISTILGYSSLSLEEGLTIWKQQERAENPIAF